MEYHSNNNSNGAFTASNGSTGSIASNTAPDSNNRKPATARQLVRENVQYLIEQLEAGKSEALTAFLDAMAHFRNYSFGNVLLIARQKPQATNVAGMWAWNELGRRVKRGEKGIAILAPMVAKARKDEAKNDSEDNNRPSLLGFRRVYVWDRLSRDLRPAWPATVRRRRARRSCVRLDGSSHIIAQFAGPLQGGLNADEFQFAGGDLSGGFVVSSGCA
jgi:hypothetical protein